MTDYKPIRVIVTGSRHWKDYQKIRDALLGLAEDSVVIQGGARGADALANQAALELGLECTTVYADWETYGKAAGPIRNQRMLDMKPDVVFAFPLPDSIGTKDMMERARKAGVLVVVFE